MGMSDSVLVKLTDDRAALDKAIDDLKKSKSTSTPQDRMSKALDVLGAVSELAVDAIYEMVKDSTERRKKAEAELEVEKEKTRQMEKWNFRFAVGGGVIAFIAAGATIVQAWKAAYPDPAPVVAPIACSCAER
jgi:hypothetical protein